MSASIAPIDRAWVDVDLTALVANARTVSSVSGAPLLPMVKADGYGTGAVTVARALEALDPWGFGVATVEVLLLAADQTLAATEGELVEFDLADLREVLGLPTLTFTIV